MCVVTYCMCSCTCWLVFDFCCQKLYQKWRLMSLFDNNQKTFCKKPLIPSVYKETNSYGSARMIIWLSLDWNSWLNFQKLSSILNSSWIVCLMPKMANWAQPFVKRAILVTPKGTAILLWDFITRYYYYITAFFKHTPIFWQTTRTFWIYFSILLEKEHHTYYLLYPASLTTCMQGDA